MNDLHDELTASGAEPVYWNVAQGAPTSRGKMPAWFIGLMTLAVVTIAACAISLLVHSRAKAGPTIHVTEPKDMKELLASTQNECQVNAKSRFILDKRIRFLKNSHIPCKDAMMLLEGVLERSSRLSKNKYVNIPVYPDSKIVYMCGLSKLNAIACSDKKNVMWILPQEAKS